MKDMLKVDYVPLLQECCKVYEDGFGDAVTRHMENFLSFGVSVSRVLNKKDERVEQDPRLVHYGLANCVWTGLVDTWWNLDSGAREGLDIQGQRVENVMESLMDVLDNQVDLKAAISSDNGMKVLQFWLSHIGKLAKKLPEAGGLIIERIWLWSIGLRNALMGTEQDGEERKEKISKLVSRVIVACLNNQSKKTLEKKFLIPLRKQIASSSMDEKKAALIVSIHGIWAESEGFSPALFDLGLELADEVLKAFVMPRMQSKITYCIIHDTSKWLVEFLVNYMAQSMAPDVAVMLLLRYSVCPHPSLLAVLSNVWMDLVRYSSNSMQMIFIECLESLLLRMASHLAAGTSKYQGPTQAILQVRDLYAMCLSQASEKNFHSIMNQLQSRIDDTAVMNDVCVIAEITYTASGLCLRGGREVADLGERIAQAMVETVEKVLDSGINSVDTILLLSWCEEAIAESFMLMMSDTRKKLKATDVERIMTSLNRTVDLFKQQGAEFNSIPVFKMLLRCHQAVEYLGLLGVVHRIQKPLLALASACSHPSHPAFGYMLAAIIHEKGTNSMLMKNIFRAALLDESSTEPLRIIALKSYIEYIRQCPQENITAVLPDELVYQASGKPNADFKFILSAYVEGKKSSQDDTFTVIQKEGMLSSAHVHMSKMAFRLRPFPKQALHQAASNGSFTKIEKSCIDAKHSIQGLLSTLEHHRTSINQDVVQCLKRHVVDMESTIMKIRDAYVHEV